MASRGAAGQVYVCVCAHAHNYGAPRNVMQVGMHADAVCVQPSLMPRRAALDGLGPRAMATR
jgi:hypothetical protein